MMQNLTVDEASAFISLVYDSSLEKNQWSSPVGQLFALCPGHVAAVVTFEDAKWVSSHVPVLPGGEHGAQITELMDDVEAGEVSQPDDLNDTLFRRNQIQAVHEKVGVTSTRDLADALSVFRSVGAMYDDAAPL